ncbi:MAG: hypothetical protein O8C56_01195, partial [Candidatus Methanoperedens sp.]|nr:hypothetical protein [Candidatus Methanoperedens sp.]
MSLPEVDGMGRKIEYSTQAPDFIDKFIAGAPDERITQVPETLHTYVDLEIAGDSLFYIRKDFDRVYIPVCKKLPGNIFILNACGFDEITTAGIDTMMMRRLEALPDNITIFRFQMPSNTGSPKIKISWKSLDDEVGYQKLKLANTKTAKAHLTADPDYNIPDTLEELEEQIQGYERSIKALMIVVREQVQQEQLDKIKECLWCINWLKEIKPGTYDPENNIEQSGTIKHVMDIRKEMEEFGD